MTLESKSREPFVDFLKGVAILFVVLTHCLPNQKEIGFSLWGGEAVPLFLIIQSWHFLKKPSVLSVKKIFRRIMLPFLLVEAFLLAVAVVSGIVGGDLWPSVKSFVRSGGNGPGAYYVWIYLQFAAILPIISFLSERISAGWMFLILLLVSVLVEMGCCLFDCPYYLYRLLAFRYIFLLWFGLDWAKTGLKMTWLRFVISVASAAATWYMVYRGPALKPFIFDAWPANHWFCYFYVGWFFAWLLRIIYSRCGKAVRLFFEELGKSSYAVFLTQLVVFTLIWFLPGMPKWCFCLIAIACSILPPLVYNNLKKNDIHLQCH